MSIICEQRHISKILIKFQEYPVVIIQRTLTLFDYSRVSSVLKATFNLMHIVVWILFNI